MQHAFRAFMEQIIDYAGIFPPASLSLEASIHNYARYRTGPEAWMLGRFICPAGRLDDLSSYGETLFAEAGEPFRFSVLIRPAFPPDPYRAAVKEDLQKIAAFVERHGDRVRVEALELKLPPKWPEILDGADPGKFLDEVAEVIEQARIAPVQPFYELPPLKAGTGMIPRAVEIFAAHRQEVVAGSGSQYYRSPALKLRCGGVEPHLYPTSAQVAEVILSCRDAAVPLKATAGLHHPVRHYNADAKVTMHGFFNVFGAAILAAAHSLEASTVQEIIEDEHPKHFQFEANSFQWRGFSANTEQISRYRRELMLSFGSCSFEEPRDDLRALGLL